MKSCKQIIAIILLILPLSCEKVKDTKDEWDEEVKERQEMRQASEPNELVLVFEGYTLRGTLFPKKIYLENKKQEAFSFSPNDPTSIEQSSFLVNPAWSPDGSWLVLPNGRFDGFVAFRSNTLPEGVKDKTKAREIRVALATGSRLWHEFVGWQSPAVFQFRAGLSDSYLLFEYDFDSGTIKSLDRKPDMFEFTH